MNDRSQPDGAADREPRKRNDAGRGRSWSDDRRPQRPAREGAEGGSRRESGDREPRQGRGSGGRDGGYRGRDERGGTSGRDNRPRGGDRGREDRGNARGGDERGGYHGREERGGSRGSADRGRGEREGYRSRDDRGSGRGEDRRPRSADDRGRRPWREGERGERPRGERGERDPRRPHGEREARDGRRYRDQDDRRPGRDGGRDREGWRPRREDERGPRGPRRDDDRGKRPPRRDFGDQDARRPRRDGAGAPRRDDHRGFDRDQGQGYGRGGTRGGGRSDRGGRGREFTEAERLQHELRPVRSEHQDPVIPDEVQAKDLHPAARNELKTLQPDVQDRVARHLAMVAMLIDDDVELAHQHALSASRRAGRIPVTRETLAITAYRQGDFALALRELRTHRRLSGSDGHVALMVDCERGLGRPEKGIETGLEVDRAGLDTEQRVHLAIAMSGARLDLGQTQQALFELEIPELNPKKAYSWSPELFGAYAAVLEDLGRDGEAAKWEQHARRAAAALQEHLGALDELEVFEVLESAVEAEAQQQPGGAQDASGGGADAEAAENAGAASADAEPGGSASSEDAGSEDARAEAAPAEAAFAEAASAEMASAEDPVDAVSGTPAEAEAPRGFAEEIEAEVDELLAEAGIVEDGEDCPGRGDV